MAEIIAEHCHCCFWPVWRNTVAWPIHIATKRHALHVVRNRLWRNRDTIYLLMYWLWCWYLSFISGVTRYKLSADCTTNETGGSQQRMGIQIFWTILLQASPQVSNPNDQVKCTIPHCYQGIFAEDDCLRSTCWSSELGKQYSSHASLSTIKFRVDAGNEKLRLKINCLDVSTK